MSAGRRRGLILILIPDPLRRKPPQETHMHSRNSPFIPAAALLTALLFSAIGPCVVWADSTRVCGSLFACAVISDTTRVMVGDRGRIFLSKDGAKTWESVDGGTTAALSSVCFPDRRHGWIVGQAGTLLHSADGGKTWEAQSAGVETYLLDVDFLDPLHGIAVGAETTVLTTADGGATWKPSPLKSSAGLLGDLNLFAAVMMDPRSACIVGDMGWIFVTEDGGLHWSETKTSLYDDRLMMGRVLYALAYDSGTLYAAGIDSTFAVSKDRGRSWAMGDTGFSKPDLYGIDFVGKFGMAAGSGGHLIRTTDGGATWHAVDVPERIKRIWLNGMDLRQDGSGKVSGLIVGKDGTFGRIADGAVKW